MAKPDIAGAIFQSLWKVVPKRRDSLAIFFVGLFLGGLLTLAFTGDGVGLFSHNTATNNTTNNTTNSGNTTNIIITGNSEYPLWLRCLLDHNCKDNSPLNNNSSPMASTSPEKQNETTPKEIPRSPAPNMGPNAPNRNGQGNRNSPEQKTDSDPCRAGSTLAHPCAVPDTPQPQQQWAPPDIQNGLTDIPWLHNKKFEIKPNGFKFNFND